MALNSVEHGMVIAASLFVALWIDATIEDVRARIAKWRRGR
jgi:hypothetical protein